MQQATVNLFADMSVQPASLQAGLDADRGLDRHAGADLRRSPRPRPARRCRAARPSRFTARPATRAAASSPASRCRSTAAPRGVPRPAATSWSYVWTPAALSTHDTAGDVQEPRRRRQRQHRDAAARASPSRSPRSAGWSPRTGSTKAAGTPVADISGNGNTGTISGATWTAGKFGQALSFDGINDLGDGQRRHLARSHQRDDARGVDQPDHAQRLAERDPQGDDDDGLAYALYANDNLPRPSRHARHRQRHRHAGRRAAAAEHLDALGGDLRRSDGPPLRQRHR